MVQAVVPGSVVPVVTVPGDNVGSTIFGLILTALTWVALGACLGWGWHFAEWTLSKA